MKSLKHALVALAGVAALVLAGCGSGEPITGGSDSGSGGDHDSKEITIGFAISTLQNPFFVSMKEGVDEAAKKLGINLKFADASDDANTQSNDVLNFITEGVDVAVLNATDGEAIASSVEALNKAGIPVITVDRTSEGGEIVAHIGTDNVTAGEVTAKAFFEALGGKGKVAILEGVPGASSAIDRGTGFDNVLADFPDISIVAKQTANYQRSEGLTVAQNILQANPDLVGFLSMNDEMALGAVEAINAAGKAGKVKTIGIDGGADAVKAVCDGSLVATVAQQSKVMGSQSIEQAVKVAKGEKIEKLQPVDVVVIDSSNCKDYL
ncbi:substrate-binding domain-containing protein [Schaalia sp. ZJ1691]|uniref:substrate-binding domain-containing protein n=1 Tax=Schaalia sp. ZJ1691 TaxID=2709404 RepID=UPI0013EABA4B|nr:substrate-binding domain-containing protein [Schaalia sp. ZJ1691]